jgi:hypothetical protein
VHPPQGVNQVNAVADGDLLDGAALAGQQDRDPGLGDLRVHARARRPRRGELVQAGEPVRVADLGHCRGQMAVRAGEHPGQPGPDHVAADQHQQTGGQLLRVTVLGLAAFA